MGTGSFFKQKYGSKKSTINAITVKQIVRIHRSDSPNFHFMSSKSQQGIDHERSGEIIIVHEFLGPQRRQCSQCQSTVRRVCIGQTCDDVDQSELGGLWGQRVLPLASTSLYKFNDSEQLGNQQAVLGEKQSEITHLSLRTRSTGHFDTFN